MSTTSSVVTALLGQDRADERELMDELFPLVYDELRAMAHNQLAGERGPRTLNTTGLVHEVFLRLVDPAVVPLRNRRYFFGAAARAMRQVLIQAARSRTRQKRGGGATVLPLDESTVAVDDYAEELLALDDALQRFARDHPRASQVVECRYFGGLSVEETAELLEVSPRTVKREWMLARAWLHRELSRDV